MLDRTAARVDDVRHGDWSREQLLEMNERFVVVVEAAFQAGLESRLSARAIFRAKSRLVGQEQVVEAAWRWFCRNRDAEDIPFSAVVARCRGIDPMRIRASFDRRFGRRSGVSSA
jgi:hypothetical protein